MKKVYLAGPMSGIENHNYPAFEVAAAELRAVGYDVVSPREEHPADEAPYSGWTWEQFLRADLALMLRCDGLVVLPGWEGSRGATLEVDTADQVKMPFWTLERALRNAPGRTGLSLDDVEEVGFKLRLNFEHEVRAITPHGTYTFVIDKLERADNDAPLLRLREVKA